MKKIKLSNGTEIPQLGLGTWQLTGKNCITSVKTALKLGYTHIDTAEIYGNQKEIGEALKEFDRTKLFLTSKVWHANLKYNDVLEACKQTLKDLGTNYLDLYLIHWPNKNVDMKETFRALKKLYEESRIKAVGVSNFTISHLKEALEVSKVPITVNQVEFHPFLNQHKLLMFCQENGIKITAYSPLARGRIFKNQALQEIGKKYDKSAGQVALRWSIQKGIIVIPKASSREHLKENFDIFDFKLNSEDMEKIEQLNQDKRFVNPGFSEF